MNPKASGKHKINIKITKIHVWLPIVQSPQLPTQFIFKPI
jgi:hypothetical protein